MTPENKQLLINRFKSLLWRSGMMLAALAVGFVSDNLALFHLSPGVIVVVGLVAGEITKFINQKLTV